MTIRGTLKLTELRLAQLSVDYSKAGLQVSCLLSLTDPGTGASGWYKCSGSNWSKETLAALEGLVQCMERDVSQGIMSTSDVEGAIRTSTTVVGIGEHIGSSEVPEM